MNLARIHFLLSNQYQQQQNDSLALFTTVFYAFYAFGVIFLTCEFGQRLANAFEEIDDSIKTFEWNLFSHEIQKLLPTILIVSQKQFVIKCFGSTSALRESFKKVRYHASTYHRLCSSFSFQVINGAFSYFMTMHQFIKWWTFRMSHKNYIYQVPETQLNPSIPIKQRVLGAVAVEIQFKYTLI